jgi:RHS repeat-associated protein
MKKIFLILFVLMSTSVFAQNDWDNWKPYSSESYYDLSKNQPTVEDSIEYTIFKPKFYVSKLQNRFISVDPHAQNYPSVSPYAYVGNSPINIIDPDGMDWYEINDNIEWHEGSDPVLKPGFGNWIASLFGGGDYAASLGANVLVANGAPFGESVNESVFYLYLETNTSDPSATLVGNTVPSDQSMYGTIASGLYSSELVQYHGNPALLLNGGGDIPVMFGNPNNSRNSGLPTSQHIADRIYFHAGNSARESLTTWGGQPISQGCLTGSHGNRPAYLNFMNNIQTGWNGNVYLRRTYNGQRW